MRVLSIFSSTLCKKAINHIPKMSIPLILTDLFQQEIHLIKEIMNPFHGTFKAGVHGFLKRVSP